MRNPVVGEQEKSLGRRVKESINPSALVHQSISTTVQAHSDERAPPLVIYPIQKPGCFHDHRKRARRHDEK